MVHDRKVGLFGVEYTILFPLYHPASIIYNRDLRNVYLKDIEELKKLLHQILI